MLSEKEFNAELLEFRPYIVSRVKRLGGGEDTEDYVQDVMEFVLRHRTSFDPAKGKFVSWLWWQVRSCMQQVRARQDRRRNVNISMECHDDGEPISEAVSTIGDPHAALELREVLAAVSTLKPREADLVLQRAEGVRWEDIGEEYGVSHQAVQQTHRTAVVKLRKKIRPRLLPPVRRAV